MRSSSKGVCRFRRAGFSPAVILQPEVDPFSSNVASSGLTFDLAVESGGGFYGEWHGGGGGGGLCGGYGEWQYGGGGRLMVILWYGMCLKKEYQSQFEQLLTHVDITEFQFVSMFIAGLPASMEMNVRMFRQKTLAYAFSLANFQEASLDVIRQKTMPLLPTLWVNSYYANKNVNYLNKTNIVALPVLNTQAVTRYPALPSPAPRKQLSQMEFKRIYASIVIKSICLDTSVVDRCTIKWNFQDLVMKFVYEGRKMCLTGTKQSELQWMSGKQLSRQVIDRGDPYFSTINCLWPYVSLNLMQTIPEPNTPYDPELRNLLQEFGDVFGVPTELPPKRSCDYKIPLKYVSTVINIRPYRYPLNQKDVIEQMVNELLDTWVVRHSQSPFSSLIVMVKKNPSMTSHVYHLRQVLQVMREHTLYAKETQEAFERLQQAMNEALFLALPDFHKEFIIETDASGCGIGAVLEQRGHPVAFLIRTLAPKHQSLFAYEKELLSVVLALQKWRGYLFDRHFKIKTNHFSLKYVLDQRITTPFQSKWLPKLLGFDYEIEYKKGKENVVVDALLRVQRQSKIFTLLSKVTTNEFMDVVTKF
ncbi:putative mitochondrial protein [Tanacetum coccineum]